MCVFTSSSPCLSLFRYQAHVLHGESGVNKGIQLIAQCYSIDCKNTYMELSKIIQSVLASRRELVKYDHRKTDAVAEEEEDEFDFDSDDTGSSIRSNPFSFSLQKRVCVCA